MPETKRMSVTLDPELVAEAVERTGASSQREAIETALRYVVRRKKLEAMVERGGSVPLDLSVDELLAGREGE